MLLSPVSPLSLTIYDCLFTIVYCKFSILSYIQHCILYQYLSSENTRVFCLQISLHVCYNKFSALFSTCLHSLWRLCAPEIPESSNTVSDLVHVVLSPVYFDYSGPSHPTPTTNSLPCMQFHKTEVTSFIKFTRTLSLNYVILT